MQSVTVNDFPKVGKFVCGLCLSRCDANVLHSFSFGNKSFACDLQENTIFGFPRCRIRKVCVSKIKLVKLSRSFWFTFFALVLPSAIFTLMFSTNPVKKIKRSISGFPGSWIGKICMEERYFIFRCIIDQNKKLLPEVTRWHFFVFQENDPNFYRISWYSGKILKTPFDAAWVLTKNVQSVFR